MKRGICAVLILVTFLSLIPSGCAAGSESILPPLNKALGVCLPPLDQMYAAHFKGSREMDTGAVRFEFEQISAEDYRSIGRLLALYGCAPGNAVTAGDAVTAEATVEGRTIVVTYDLERRWMDVIYPKYFYTERRTLSASFDRSALPDLQQAFGVLLPRFSNVLGRLPDAEETAGDGTLKETYRRFTEEDYGAVSQYLLDAGCSVTDYHTEGRTLVISLEKGGAAFVLNYDPDGQTASVQYPASSRPEPGPLVTPTPGPTAKPTATPKPTPTTDEYNTYAAIFVAAIKGTRKNPSSLQVHWIKVMEYKGDSYIVINFSAQNGFGGYNRETYSFIFELGHISLSGDSSDYDMYENHKDDFRTVRSLDVDDVMRIVNK